MLIEVTVRLVLALCLASHDLGTACRIRDGILNLYIYSGSGLRNKYLTNPQGPGNCVQNGRVTAQAVDPAPHAISRDAFLNSCV